MKTDRIFVLLLVVMLPMSGCFNDAVGDAEGTDDTASGTTVINNYYNNTTISENSLPVIIGGFSPTTTCPIVGADCATNEMVWPVLGGSSMVLDYDGYVVSFGVDFDMDYVIDLEMPGNYSQYETRVNFEMNESFFNPIHDTGVLDQTLIDAGWSSCHQWVNIIAIDDDNGTTIVPQRWGFDWDRDSQTCVVESDPSDYRRMFY
ncbi:hypothetical protein N9V58_00380 [Candidatus Poseidoniales archaeon]|nr:hypothetical protein [Candidatus Poseidoniales archaeon]